MGEDPQGRRRSLVWDDPRIEDAFRRIHEILTTLVPLPLTVAKLEVYREKMTEDIEELREENRDRTAHDVALTTAIHELRAEVTSAKRLTSFIAFLIPVAAGIIIAVLN